MHHSLFFSNSNLWDNISKPLTSTSAKLFVRGASMAVPNSGSGPSIAKEPSSHCHSTKLCARIPCRNLVALADSFLMPDKQRDFSQRSNQELLELLLRSGNRAEQILKEVPIEKLDQAHRQELRLTPKAYERLQASIEIGRRIHESKTSFRAIIKISSSSDAIAYCQRHFARLASDCLQEEFHIVTLDTKNQVIASHQITIGTLDASLVHPREVFRKAIKDAASSIILAHNHPSGDPTPSREDIAVTDRLTDVGKTIGIDVLDHIVLGKENCVSIQEFR